jgi:hypothetical protein
MSRFIAPSLWSLKGDMLGYMFRLMIDYCLIDPFSLSSLLMLILCSRFSLMEDGDLMLLPPVIIWFFIKDPVILLGNDSLIFLERMEFFLLCLLFLSFSLELRLTCIRSEKMSAWGLRDWRWESLVREPCFYRLEYYGVNFSTSSLA